MSGAAEIEKLAASREITAPPASERLVARLKDRSKWPRKWWWPLPEKLDLSPEDWKKQHDEISKAINKLLLVLIGFCFFCGLALGAPDRSLLASDATVTLPFASASISFVYFLVLAPLVLVGLSSYLHIFIGYWVSLSRQQPQSSGAEQAQPPLPFVFNLKDRTARWLSNILFYWLVPAMLGVFTWKALPRPEAARELLALTSVFIVIFLFLLLRRRAQTLKIASLLNWLGILGGLFIAALAVYAWTENNTLFSRQLHLRKGDLSKQDLEGLNLSGADLTDAKLTGARLTEAVLSHADLNGADLTGADLHGATLAGANLASATMDGADLLVANLNDANLTDANLTDARLSGANLNQARLDGATLDGANLDGANLDGANLDGAHLDGVGLEGATLNGANLTRANLTRANLTDADLTDADLTRAHPTRAILRLGHLKSADLSGAKLTRVRLIGAFDQCCRSDPAAGRWSYRRPNYKVAHWGHDAQGVAQWTCGAYAQGKRSLMESQHPTRGTRGERQDALQN